MSTVFACDMTAIPAEERAEHHALIRRLMDDAREELIERVNGFDFRFPAEEYDAVARFVGGERLCCPFLTFTLDLSAERGPLWLRIRGPAGGKEFMRAELGLTDAAGD